MKNLRPLLLSFAVLLVCCQGDHHTDAAKAPAHAEVGKTPDPKPSFKASDDALVRGHTWIDDLESLIKVIMLAAPDNATVQAKGKEATEDTAKLRAELQTAQAANTDLKAKFATTAEGKARAEKASADWEKYAHDLEAANEQLRQEAAWDEKYGLRLFNICIFVGGLAALSGTIAGAGFFYPMLRPFRMPAILAGVTCTLAAVLGMLFLEFHKEIMEFIKWSVIGTLSLGVIALALVMAHKWEQGKVEDRRKALELEAARFEAEGRAKVMEVLAIIKADGGFGANGVLDANDKSAITRAYSMLDSKYHKFLGEFIAKA